VRRCLTLVLALAGASACYSPSIKNQGYACDPTETKPCPDGYQCIDGLCDDGSGVRPRQLPAGDDMAIAAPTGGGDDLATPATAMDQAMASQPDLAQPQAPPDFAQPPPDLARPPDLAPSCAPLGGHCRHDSDCCSHWCDYPTSTCTP
jgi:hypothetical protein